MAGQPGQAGQVGQAGQAGQAGQPGQPGLAGQTGQAGLAGLDVLAGIISDFDKGNTEDYTSLLPSDSMNADGKTVPDSYTSFANKIVIDIYKSSTNVLHNANSFILCGHV